MKYLAAPLILVALVAAGILILIGRDVASFEEVLRVPSADARIDAVVVESNGGATTAYGYFVCVVGRGEACDPDDAVATAYAAGRKDGARGLETVWTSVDALDIRFASARRWRLLAPTIDAGGRAIKVSVTVNGLISADTPE